MTGGFRSSFGCLEFGPPRGSGIERADAAFADPAAVIGEPITQPVVLGSFQREELPKLLQLRRILHRRLIDRAGEK